MRVITGSARGMRLETLEGLDVRPTTDQVKESIFSIIQFEIEDAKVLDLFAGCGQLGIEALSRGAKSATFVDNSRKSIEVVEANLKHTKLSDKALIKNEDSIAFLHRTREKFDIAFLDPPYRQGLIDKALPLLADKMETSGIIVCETGKDEVLPEKAGAFSVYREYKYGKIKLTVYRMGDETD